MNIEPNTQKFLDALAAAGGPPIYTLTPEEARKVLSKAQAGPVTAPAAETEDRTLPVGPTGATRIRIYRPQGIGENPPVIVFFHGAGWVMGGIDTHDRLVHEIAEGAQAVVVFVDYDRAPESQYPTQIEEDYAALRYVAEHGRELGVDTSRLAIVGDSVGGNMTAVISLLAKERGGPEIRFQVMFYPVTDANFETGSYNEFADGPWLTREAMKWFWNAYLPDEAQRKEPHASPLQASVDELKGLPPALIIVDENDVLRDEGEAYARKLTQAGVNVTAVRELGTIHDFVMLNGLRDTPPTRGAIALATSMLRQALAGDMRQRLAA